MRTKLAKIARIEEIAKEKPEEKFTSLAHLLDEAMLKECHRALTGNRVPGIDQVSKEEYGANLEANIAVLIGKLKSKAYRPQPVRRAYIPKPGSKEKRPLGIPSYEDKLVQMGLTKILNAIYEQDFLGLSYGFRPNRSCHDALKVLNNIIETKEINYIVDADIKGFFDNVNHEWMMKFLGHRVTDPSIHRLIKRILRAGVMEGTEYHKTEQGTPQGGVISPLLANIYLHYALDLWFEGIYKKTCQGDAYMVRYADDFVCCFQYEEDAKRFYVELQVRLAKFNLMIAEEKSKIIEFGRFAAEERAKRGKGKPDTFDFLGFTHYCSKSRRGKFRVKRKTSRKKYHAKIKQIKEWIRNTRNIPMLEQTKLLRLKLIGHYRYYGITDNYRALQNYQNNVYRLWYKWLNRRSQRKSFNWDTFRLFCRLNRLPNPKIYVNIYG